MEEIMLNAFSKNFVCEDYERTTFRKHIPAPVFRKAFSVDDKLENAEIMICGLGFYELFVNGVRITKGILAPYISNTDHMAYYDYYDLHSFMREGENVIAIMLGDGFQNGKTVSWEFENNVFNSAPKLALTLSVRDGEGVRNFEAGDFVCKKGPVMFNDLRCGVFFDKRKEEAGWTEPGFYQDDTWHEPLRAEQPRGQAVLCEVEPIVVTKELQPVRIYPGKLGAYETREDNKIDYEPCEKPTPKEGGWIYDFGENNAGIFRLKIKGKKGQRIDIQSAEIEKDGTLDYMNWQFYPDGYIQRDIYICGSDEEEIYEPMFTYHGFRYLYVNGITEEQATKELLTFVVMSSDLEKRGEFECSDEMANRIYKAAERSDISNFYYFPTDCPHREKNGWTGDIVVSAEHYMLTWGVEKSLREWLRNLRMAQKETGQIPCICPTGNWGYAWGTGPAWDCVLFEVPYMIYRYRGNKDVIEENAHAMMSYLEYVSKKRNEDGVVEYGLGDWVPVDRLTHEYVVPLGFSDSLMVYHMCTMAEEMFVAVGLSLNAAYARQLGREMYDVIRSHYVDTERMTIQSECMSAQALGIYFHIFKEEEEQDAFARLLEFIHANDDKIDCGFLGFRVLFHVLAQHGETQLAWNMITRKEYPSYGWYMEQGYTTLPEHFCEKLKLPSSCNHHFLGDVVQWFMRYPAGLQIENDRKVRIEPHFIDSLEYAKASHILPSGEVSVSWRRENGVIKMHVTCPENVECIVETGENEVVRC